MHGASDDYELLQKRVMEIDVEGGDAYSLLSLDDVLRFVAHYRTDKGVGHATVARLLPCFFAAQPDETARECMLAATRDYSLSAMLTPLVARHRPQALLRSDSDAEQDARVVRLYRTCDLRGLDMHPRLVASLLCTEGGARRVPPITELHCCNADQCDWWHMLVDQLLLLPSHWRASPAESHHSSLPGEWWLARALIDANRLRECLLLEERGVMRAHFFNHNRRPKLVPSYTAEDLARAVVRNDPPTSEMEPRPCNGRAPTLLREEAVSDFCAHLWWVEGKHLARPQDSYRITCATPRWTTTSHERVYSKNGAIHSTVYTLFMLYEVRESHLSRLPFEMLCALFDCVTMAERPYVFQQ